MIQYKESYSSLQVHLDISKPVISQYSRPDIKAIAINANSSRSNDYYTHLLLDALLTNCGNFYVNSKTWFHSDFIQKLLIYCRNLKGKINLLDA